MLKRSRLLILASLAVVCLAVGIVLFSSRSGRARLGLKKDLNYILITVDTLRADKISPYGFSQIETPTMELFASRGVKFEDCVSPTPLTLPSHCSIMTGTYPAYHSVRDNGGFILPRALSTLAEQFKNKDYETAAFVGAYVLDSKWGLNRGFDYYFDKFDLSRYKEISLGEVQRRGEEVINEALSWLAIHKNNKFFAWIHLYDPHTPYEPPAPFAEEYLNRPYLGEIAYTDSQLGRLWTWIEQNNLVGRTALVFTSDHGESLGEHQETTHAFFIYQGTVHVPLIFVLPSKKFQAASRSQVVSLVDIMPSILEIAGIDIPAQVQGKSLVPFLTGEKDTGTALAYSETYYPRFHYGWSELKGIQNGRFKLIIAPEVELYDLQADPTESNNLASSDPAMLSQWKSQADDFIRKTSRNALQQDLQKVDEETRERLAALGYVGSFTDSAKLRGRVLADPKEKIGIFNSISEARELGLSGDYEKAENMLKKIIAEDPEIVDAHFSLGNVYFRQKKFEDARRAFQTALEKKPDDAFTVINIANCYVGVNQLDKAVKIIMDCLDQVPPDSLLYLYLGTIEKLQKKYDPAIAHLNKCLELNPYSASGYSELGAIDIIQEKLGDAEKHLKSANAINPKLQNLHYNFAQLYEKMNDLSRAAEEYKTELENVPHNFRASHNLSVIYRSRGDTENEEKYIKKTIELNSLFPLSYFYLARLYLHQGRDYRKAVDLINKGIALKPEESDLALGYFLLADLYNRLGDELRSREFAQKGKEIQNSGKNNNE